MEKLINLLVVIKFVYNLQHHVNSSNMKMEYIVALKEAVINMFNIKNALINVIMVIS